MRSHETNSLQTGDAFILCLALYVDDRILWFVILYAYLRRKRYFSLALVSFVVFSHTLGILEVYWIDSLLLRTFRLIKFAFQTLIIGIVGRPGFIILTLVEKPLERVDGILKGRVGVKISRTMSVLLLILLKIRICGVNSFNPQGLSYSLSWMIWFWINCTITHDNFMLEHS